MTAGAKRMMLKLSAVIIFVAAGIRMLKLFEKGFTAGGVFLPAFLTVVGIIWLLVASRAEDCCEPQGVTMTSDCS